MGKTLQFLFIFFVVAICGIGVYFGLRMKGNVEELYKRVADLEAYNIELKNQIKTLATFSDNGANKIVKGEVDLSKFPGAKAEDKDIKPKINKSFYCNAAGSPITVVKFFDDGTFKYWHVEEDKFPSFKETEAHAGKGEYLIHGLELYATFENGVMVQKRVLNILSMDKSGNILQLHGAGENFMTTSCPQQLQSF